MSLDFIKYAFVAGEVSPTLLGRSDLEKYDLGVELAKNFFVDYRGGMSNRPGSDFVDEIQYDWKETKFVPFKFSPSVATNYAILFGYNYIRFIQDGAYVLEAAKVITDITQANPAVVTAVGHGYTTGDLVKIYDVVGMTEVNQRTFVVTVLGANTFELHALDLAGTGINASSYTGYISGGNVYRVYTVVSPYADTDLALLRAKQIRSVIRLTHKSYKTRTLTRISDTSWTLALRSIGAELSPPTGLTITPSGAGTAGVAFAVTAINADGEESIASAYAFNALCVDYASAAGSVKLTWTAVANAVRYNVYRSQIIPVGADITRAMEVGFLGVAYGPDFTDRNIIPDFTTTPPVYDDPFADGAIEFIRVTAGGAGYTRASVVSATVGSGFVGYPVVSSGGVLLGIVVVKGGSGYTGATVISVTVGAGATFTTTLSDSSGNDPGVSNVFQQREVLAGSTNQPLTIWASHPGELENHDVSSIVVDSDAYEFDLDSAEVASIEHLVATRSGLVIFSQAGIWQLTGGSGVAVTPTNALADPQSYNGCSTVPPLVVDTELLYTEAKGNTVRMLSYNDFTKVYAGQDLSILANHLITPTNRITAWDYASDPFKLVYAVREDGVMLTLALVKEQNVYGWGRSQTQGFYKDVLVLQEDSTDSVYVVARRFLNNRWCKTIERLHSRTYSHIEDAWFVDCGLSLGATYPNATITVVSEAEGETVTVTADSAIFAVGDIGKIIRLAGGKMVITAYTSTTSVDAYVLREMTELVPEITPEFALAAPDEWTMDTPVSSVSGLWHLEGKTVKILADGSVLPDQVVVDGTVTLPTPATRVIVGLGYQGLMRPLPESVPNATLEGKLKRVVQVRLRVYDSRGLEVGQNLERLYPFKERSTELYGEPTRSQSGIKVMPLTGGYDRGGQFYMVQNDPLPVTVLGFTALLEAEDAPNPGD